MENGRNIYYSGNTLKSPRPSAKNIKRRNAVYNAQLVVQRSIEFKPKIVAHSRCIWCKYKYEDNRFFVVCPRCRMCQYCGLVAEHDLSHCYLCGNMPDDNVSTPIEHRYTAFLNSEDHPNKRTGSVIRPNAVIHQHRPQTANRRPHSSSSGY